MHEANVPTPSAEHLNAVREEISSARDRAFFDRVWATPFHVYLNRIRAIGFVALGRVLDIGCGFGQWTLALACLNEHVVGLDISRERVRAARVIADALHMERIQFQAGSIEEVSIEESRFDGVFSYSALYCTDFRCSFRKIHHMLRRNGVFYFSTNDLGWYIYNILDEHNSSSDYNSREKAIEAIQNTICYFAGEMWETGIPVIMPKHMILNELRKAGFEIISEGADGNININGVEDVTSFYDKTKYNLTNVYEVLCRKR